LVTFTVDVAGCDVMGNEPIYQDSEIVGYVTSGMYAHHVDRSVALGYVPTGLAADVSDGAFAIEILGEMRPATIAPRALFDPDASRMRG
ncbi:MAG: glycine cleavage T C-terminal barrel domain-containing protein, partial [Pseudomonadota bacterium]|nr:glycine cleavage T C-terminal barrel domain-containing protein [Pseudomonadota bacterium]